MRLSLVALALVACDGAERRVYPRDQELTLAHAQVKGTHNSYHVMTLDNEPWRYTHAPLAEQLADQGVRQFELDVYSDVGGGEGRFRVMHIPVIDEGTTCARLVGCLRGVRGWSDDAPQALPIVILLEPKTEVAAAERPAYFADLEADLLAAWPRERIVTPAEVRGSFATLRDALETRGWTPLASMRGRVLFVLLDSGVLRDAYVARGEGLIFPAGGLGDRWAGVALVDDPIGGLAQIQAALGAGMLVRTRSDADGIEARANDPTMREAALASGAQFVSTDFPAKVDGIDYVVEIPDGNPARCNPVSAPPGCVSSDIE